MQHERINASHCHMIAKNSDSEINTGVLLIKSTHAMRTLVQGWMDYQLAHPWCELGADQLALTTAILQREHVYQQTVDAQYNNLAFSDPYCTKGVQKDRNDCWKELMNQFRPLTHTGGRNPGGDPICELGCKDDFQCHYCSTIHDEKEGRPSPCNESAAIFFHRLKNKNDTGVYFPPFIVP